MLSGYDEWQSVDACLNLGAGRLTPADVLWIHPSLKDFSWGNSLARPFINDVLSAYF